MNFDFEISRVDCTNFELQDKQQISEFKKKLQNTLSEMIKEDESQKEV